MRILRQGFILMPIFEYIFKSGNAVYLLHGHLYVFVAFGTI